jgi:hypothetical protein
MIDEHNDVATASLLEVFIDETERPRHSPLRACRAADAPTGPLGVQSRRNR